MRPPPPAIYRRTRFAASALGKWFDQPTRIALRQIGRWPLRAALTCTGIAFAVGLLIMALQWNDSIEYTAEKFFFEAQHQTLSIGFAEPQALRVVDEFAHLPGVMMVEPWRAVSADFSFGTVEVLEGRRPAAMVPVTRLFETTIGMPAVMHLDTLNT